MNTLKKIWNIKELRNSILFVLLMLVVFRATAHIPLPGVNPEGLRQFLQGNQLLGLLNVFSGGTLENFSIVMLGVAPYITASIIFQLLAMVVPSLEELQKEGESGQQKIAMYTRITSVPLAMLQAFGLIRLFQQSGTDILTLDSGLMFASVIVFATAGTIFLMWIGELITERKIGNGISLLIFAGIISALPGVIQNLILNYNPADLFTYLIFAAIALFTIVAIVFINEGQRNIPVNYARRQVGARVSGGSTTYLPLRVNMAGVIPIIFAISIIIFPTIVAQFFVNGTGRLADISLAVMNLFQNQLFYGIAYFVLVFGFTYFYTAVIFKPEKIAENLQRQGGFIPGIRPGKETIEYLNGVMTKLVFTGALFLAVVAVMPVIIQSWTGIQSLAIGGTGLLIVVSVAIDIAKQIEAQLSVHEYSK